MTHLSPIKNTNKNNIIKKNKYIFLSPVEKNFYENSVGVHEDKTLNKSFKAFIPVQLFDTDGTLYAERLYLPAGASIERQSFIKFISFYVRLMEIKNQLKNKKERSKEQEKGFAETKNLAARMFIIILVMQLALYIDSKQYDFFGVYAGRLYTKGAPKELKTQFKKLLYGRSLKIMEEFKLTIPGHLENIVELLLGYLSLDFVNIEMFLEKNLNTLPTLSYYLTALFFFVETLANLRKIRRKLMFYPLLLQLHKTLGFTSDLIPYKKEGAWAVNIFIRWFIHYDNTFDNPINSGEAKEFKSLSGLNHVFSLGRQLQKKANRELRKIEYELQQKEEGWLNALK
jgi:hypothetical protein